MVHADREREREELVTFLGQLPGQMWEYTDTSVTYEGASWGHLGPSWGHLGPSWGPLGLAWSQLGALLVRLGPPWPLLGCFVRKSQAKRCFSKISPARFCTGMVFWTLNVPNPCEGRTLRFEIFESSRPQQHSIAKTPFWAPSDRRSDSTRRDAPECVNNGTRATPERQEWSSGNTHRPNSF